MGLVQKAFSDIITFSRSSNATRVGPTGVLEYAPHNLLARSEEFDNAYWSKDQSSIVANSVAAPNGTVTADKIVEDTATQTHGIYRLGFTVTSGLTYTWSVYAKKAERNWIILSAGGGANNSAWFNLNTGAAGTIQSGVAAATITSVGNDWYRCSVTRTVSSGSANFECYASTADNTSSYTGDGTSGIYLWGAQLSVGPYALDYTPTTSAAVYGPRFDYDPVTLAARGLLVEEQRTNLCPYSETLDSWAYRENTTVSANQIAAPDGTVTADKLIASAVSGLHFSQPSAVFSKATSAITYTVSAFVKSGGYKFSLSADDAATGGAETGVFNPVTGVFDTAGGGGVFTFVSQSAVSFGNGWYRLLFTFTTNTANQLRINFFIRNNNNDASFTGDGTSGIFIWGAQLEAGSFATSYIPTLASTVTRSADVASVNTVSPWYNSSESTLFADFDISGPSGAFGGYVAQLAVTALSNNGILIYNNSVGLGTSAYIDASSVSLGNNTANVPAKIAIAYNGSSNGAVRNGGSVSSVGTTVSGAATRLSLGSEYGGSYVMNGHLRRVAYYPRRLTNAEIQALTS